jgi:SpoVK/Ycf46/Vps4 family AAA+-type ATPase
MALLFFILAFILSIIQGFNCADLRNVCTEAGMFAIRAMREYVTQEDFMKVRLKRPDILPLDFCAQLLLYSEYEVARSCH